MSLIGQDLGFWKCFHRFFLLSFFASAWQENQWENSQRERTSLAIRPCCKQPTGKFTFCASGELLSKLSYSFVTAAFTSSRPRWYNNARSTFLIHSGTFLWTVATRLSCHRGIFVHKIQLYRAFHLKLMHNAYLVFLARFPLESVERQRTFSKGWKGNYLCSSHPEKGEKRKCTMLVFIWQSRLTVTRFGIFGDFPPQVSRHTSIVHHCWEHGQLRWGIFSEFTLVIKQPASRQLRTQPNINQARHDKWSGEPANTCWANRRPSQRISYSL